MLVQKRGQFFLVAALIIVSIVLSLGTIYNAARSQPADAKVPSLANEIKYESLQAIDNAVVNNLNNDEIDARLNSLLLAYSKSNSDKEIIFIYGKSTY